MLKDFELIFRGLFDPKIEFYLSVFQKPIKAFLEHISF